MGVLWEYLGERVSGYTFIWTFILHVSSCHPLLWVVCMGDYYDHVCIPRRVAFGVHQRNSEDATTYITGGHGNIFTQWMS